MKFQPVGTKKHKDGLHGDLVQLLVEVEHSPAGECVVIHTHLGVCHTVLPLEIKLVTQAAVPVRQLLVKN